MSTFKRKLKTDQKDSSPQSTKSHQHSFNSDLNIMLQLQRSIGNQAVQQMIQPTMSEEVKKPTPQPSLVGGHSLKKVFTGKTNITTNQQNVGVSLAKHHVSGGFMPGITREQTNVIVGGAGDSTTGGDTGVIMKKPDDSTTEEVTINSTSNFGPFWGVNGYFDWRVGFRTSGRNGWIVQEIINTYNAEDFEGNSVVPVYTPHYWEAWNVDSAGNVNPNDGSSNDYWIRPTRGNKTKGSWSMTGKVHFTLTDPLTQGFTAGGVPDAGILLSTTSAPTGLGSVRLNRYANGTWDSTGSTTVAHSGTAGP